MLHKFLEVSYLKVQSTLERPLLALQAQRVDGPLRLDDAVYETFLSASWDLTPDFEGPARTLRLGRGMDHPRYGRFLYAFAKVLRPRLVVEVGTYAGGTATAWATALEENGCGGLICVDNDTYSQGTYPTITRRNLQKTGLSACRYELRTGDSKKVIPALAAALSGSADVYLVDGDHSYDGALADIENGLPMLRPGGFILVHDVDRNFRLLEETPEHPHPVYEAVMHVVRRHRLQWCILKYIRRHLAVIQI